MANRKEVYAALRTKMLAASAVTAIVSTRVHQGWLPRGLADADFPCVTIYEVVCVERTLDQGPYAGTEMTVQVDLWGRDPDVLMTLEAAVRDAIAGGLSATGWAYVHVRIASSQRMSDPDPMLERRMLTVRVQAVPA